MNDGRGGSFRRWHFMHGFLISQDSGYTQKGGRGDWVAKPAIKWVNLSIFDKRAHAIQWMTSYSGGCFLWVEKKSQAHICQSCPRYTICRTVHTVSRGGSRSSWGGDRNFQNVTSKKNQKNPGRGVQGPRKARFLEIFKLTTKKTTGGGGGN